MPYMRTLALLTGESVSLMVPVGWYSVRIALVRGMKEVIHTGPLGEARRLADGLASQAILSTYADEQVERVLRADPARRAERARGEVREALAAIRARGYASAAVPIRAGYAAVAVPLRGNEPAALGAIAIEGPVTRLRPEKPLPIEWLRIFAEIETQVRADPQRFRNHYAHLDSRTILLTPPIL
jgi:DNA-binding IclR family transcriptional regulator